MSKNRDRRDANGHRLYTEREISELLSNTKDAYRIQRLNALRRLVRTATLFYSTILGLLAVVFLIHYLVKGKEIDNGNLNIIYEPQNPRVDYRIDNQSGKTKPVYDTTSFIQTIEEESLVSRMERESVSLFDIELPREDVRELFACHVAHLIGNSISETNAPLFKAKGVPMPISKLRFRIGLKSGHSIEAALPMWGNHLMLTRTTCSFDMPVNEIKCFRGALYGYAYEEDVRTERSRRGMSRTIRGLVAAGPAECMSDDEAQRLFCMIVPLVEDTRFEWGTVLKVVTFGIWNKYHPLLSFAMTIILCLIMFLFNRFGLQKK